eukprot:7902492-Alexandrium_andersonii.AAC.1
MGTASAPLADARWTAAVLAQREGWRRADWAAGATRSAHAMTASAAVRVGESLTGTRCGRRGAAISSGRH